MNCFSMAAENNSKVITYEELLPLVEARKVYLIDIREPKELQETGWIPFAINIPLGEFSDALQSTNTEFKEKYGAEKPLLNDDKVIVYCRSGRRVETAFLKTAALEHNFQKYSGSMLDWLEKGGPLQKFE